MRSSSIRSVKLVWLCTLLPVIGFSEGSIAFSSADIELGLHHIIVSSSSPAKDFLREVPKLAKPDNWKIQFKSLGIPVRSVSVDVDQRGVHIDFAPSAFSVFDAADIPKGDLVVLYVPATSRVLVATGESVHKTGPSAGFVSCVNWALTKDKKKADVDITGSFQAGVGAAPQYAWSVKAGCPVFEGNYGEFGPSFTGEASQQANADPDSLKAGVTWRKLVPIEKSRNGFILSGDLISYEFERKTKKEPVIVDGKAVDQPYIDKNANLMWTGKAAYVSGSPSLNWTLNFIGFEAGRGVSRSVAASTPAQKGQAVTRLYFSLDVYRTLFRHDKPLVTFHGNQVLRLPFHPEPYKQVDVNAGKMFLTSKPRYWTEVETTFPLTDGVGINVQYKRGSLPPSFEFVDHQVTIGFEILLKRGG